MCAGKNILLFFPTLFTNARRLYPYTWYKFWVTALCNLAVGSSAGERRFWITAEEKKKTHTHTHPSMSGPSKNLYTISGRLAWSSIASLYDRQILPIKTKTCNIVGLRATFGNARLLAYLHSSAWRHWTDATRHGPVKTCRFETTIQYVFALVCA